MRMRISLDIIDAALTSVGQRDTWELVFPTPMPAMDKPSPCFAEFRLPTQEEGRNLKIAFIGMFSFTAGVWVL